MNEAMIINFEEVFKYGRVANLSKGMTTHEVEKALHIPFLTLSIEKQLIEVEYISADGVEIRFSDGVVDTITILIDEIYESKCLFDFDEWILGELYCFSPDDMVLALLNENISFSYHHDEREECITITLFKSGVTLNFYPLTDGKNFNDYELYSICI